MKLALLIIASTVSLTLSAHDPDLAFLLGQLSLEAPLVDTELGYGVEVEGTVPARDFMNSHVFDNAERVQRKLGELGILAQPAPKLDPGNRDFAPRSFSVVDTLHAGHWAICWEHSLTYNFFRGAVEVSTPILKTEADLQWLYAVLDDLKTGGLRAAPTRGGVHVHVGLPEPRSRRALLVAAVYMKVVQAIEWEWMRRLGVSGLRQLQPLSQLTVERIDSGPNELRVAFFSALRDFLLANPAGVQAFLDDDRYLPRSDALPIPLVRLQKLLNLGTIETTVWNSTLDPAEISGAVRFSRALASKLLAQDPPFMAFLRSGAPLKVRSLYSALGLRTPAFSVRKTCRYILSHWISGG
jgi:hypothetical protein